MIQLVPVIHFKTNKPVYNVWYRHDDSPQGPQACIGTVTRVSTKANKWTWSLPNAYKPSTKRYRDQHAAAAGLVYYLFEIIIEPPTELAAQDTLPTA